VPNYPLGTSTVNAPGVVAFPTPLQIGESVYLFGQAVAGITQLPLNPTNVAGETPVAGQASIAVNLDAREGGPAPGVFIEGQFSGAPGAFEVDIQESDTDIDADYILPTNATYKITAVVGNVFRADIIPTGGRFMRAVLVSRTNAVSLILKITRAQ